jgi:hypothetical protein
MYPTCTWKGELGARRVDGEAAEEFSTMVWAAAAESDEAAHLRPLGPIDAQPAHRRVLVAARRSTHPAPKSVSGGLAEEGS